MGTSKFSLVSVWFWLKIAYFILDINCVSNSFGWTPTSFRGQYYSTENSYIRPELTMQGKFSGMQKLRFVIRKNFNVEEHLCNMFQKLSNGSQSWWKNNFKNIVVVLRVLDKLWWDSDVIPLCPSSRDSQKDQNTKHGMSKWL